VLENLIGYAFAIVGHDDPQTRAKPAVALRSVPPLGIASREFPASAAIAGSS
jgi:hypothetical protein